MRQFSNITVKIVQRVNADNKAFAEVFIKCDEGGNHHHFYSRLHHLLTDSEHARAYQKQAFLKRQQAEELI